MLRSQSEELYPFAPSPNATARESPREQSAQRFLAARRPGTGSTAEQQGEYSWVLLEERLQASTRQEIQALREEIRIEIAHEASELRAQMAEVSAKSDFLDFRDAQVAWKAQLDWNTKMVQSLGSRSVVVEEAKALLDSQLEQLDLITKKVTGFAGGDIGGEVEAKVAACWNDVHSLKVRFSEECEELKSATSRCELARLAVEALHKDMTKRLLAIEIQLSATAAPITSNNGEWSCNADLANLNMPSKTEVARIMDACAALRLDDVRAEQQILDVRADISKQSEQLDLVCTKVAEIAEEHQVCLGACVRALEELRTKVSTVCEEQAVATRAEKEEKPSSALGHCESEKILSLIEVLMKPGEMQVASI